MAVKVELDIRAQIANLNKGLDKTQKQLKDLQKQSNKTSKTMQTNMQQTSKVAGDLKSALTVVFAVGTAVALAKSIINVRAEFEKFEAMLKVYTMANNFASNCTRELKQVPMDKYIKSLGYKEVFTAIGIRYDERHRVSNTAKEQNLIYPLANDIQVDSRFIRTWWDAQPFDLGLKDYEGNCDLCFKKSLKKRLTILKENPKIGEWWLKMENTYSKEEYPRFDLRTNKAIGELIKLSEQPFTKAIPPEQAIVKYK